MGLITAAKALLTSEGIVESGTKALDALHYSKEEKAADDVKFLDAKARLIEASGPSAITRRILAWVTAANWLLINTVWLLYWFYIVFFVDTTAELEVSTAALDALVLHKTSISEVFWLVMAFYFGTAAIGKLPSALAALKK